MENVFNVLEQRGYIEQMTHPKEIKELFGKQCIGWWPSSVGGIVPKI